MRIYMKENTKIEFRHYLSAIISSSICEYLIFNLNIYLHVQKVNRRIHK